MSTPTTAIVEFQIRPETTDMADWLSVWDVRARDALEGEPETTAYAAAVNAENALNVLIFERYAKGADSLKAHMARPAHAALSETMGARNMTKRRVLGLQFADLPDYGWWARPDRPGAEAGAILMVIGMRFADAAARDGFIGLTREHARYCWDNEPNTLIYSAGLAMADVDREIDVKTGDLIFVMGCTDMAAVTKHGDDPNHLALGPKFAALGAAPEITFTRTYRTAGKGYLWRG
jgi:quinol monooxygenase YgiN